MSEMREKNVNNETSDSLIPSDSEGFLNPEDKVGYSLEFGCEEERRL